MKKDLFILLLLILPSFSTLLRPGFFPMHDDLQTIRQLEMSQCLADGQIPCRWVSHMGNGFGYPLFNYYPPLPYLIGHVFVLFGFQFIDVVKVVAILGFCFSALGMYYLARQFWGRLGGVLSATFYTYAPYHSVDLYVRGAINEFWALVFFPLIFLAIYKVIHLKFFGAWNLVLVISVSGLMLSHNPMLMIFTPLAGLWAIYWLIKSGNHKSIITLALAGVWALGISAFFTLPILFEQSYVHVETLVIGYFNYLAHFIDLKQIFLTINWGYGGSGLGPTDGLSFALGYLHWIVPTIIIIFLLFSHNLRIHLSLSLLLLFFTLLSLFMAHSRSSIIWSFFKPLEYLQFPWRFLTLAIFFASFLSGGLAIISRKFIPILIVLVLVLNAQYFQPREWFSDQSDTLVFSDKSWSHLITGSIFDYLPKGALYPPPTPAETDIKLFGAAQAKTIAKTSNYQEYLIDVSTETDEVELQTFYFPGWRYFLNNKEQYDPILDPEFGRPHFILRNGQNNLIAKFTNTPIRHLSNYISLFSLTSLFILILFILRKPNGN